MKKPLHLLALIYLTFSFKTYAIITITHAEYKDERTVTYSYSSTSGGNSSASPICTNGSSGRGCYFGIWIIDNAGGGSKTGTAIQYVFVPLRSTWADANNAFLRAYPASGTSTTISHRVPPYTVCIAAAATPVVNIPGSDYVNQPGTICRNASAPPVPTNCSFSGSPNIDHGTLQADKVNGKQDSVSINVNCNRATSANIASLGGAINMGGGVSSTLTFDGRGLGSIYLPNGISTHTVTSTLSAANPTPGDKSGSGAIVINLP
ncbi:MULTISPECIES: hypothetical protein [unclassified Pantoea]|uniref:MrpH family fimbial adhesin n=1 Tax=unclassified Pantoea TaxID=2630326 RepID=UPI001CD57D96|nr:MULTISPECIES: hypothetical protein [unclassified Pantoea]MCA1178302.1 hypothetical protein [Pantoea sp. alder69]MCA1251846.1 hypothetical protein [Pantoea sp. alder70]MCA1266602.1 hypothetical protein [Pantoea sp. alder81]